MALTAASIFCAIDARADGDAAMHWILTGNCQRAGEEINEGIARNEAKAYMVAGYLYAVTGCVEPDFARAARYYQRAIELGDVESRAFLGLMYGLGSGVPQDYRTAYRWFSYGRVGKDLDAAHEIGYGYASTVTQLARSKVTYPHFTSDQGTVFVTFHAATRMTTFSTRGTSEKPHRAPPHSTPFINAIHAAYEEAVRQAPIPEGLLADDMAFEVPWTFEFK